MGGLGPGIGGFEIVVIGLVALLVVGPKDLPVLMRRVGQVVAKARAMANEFRASFDEMARQSELDDLRKEVEALRQGQGMYPLGKEAEDAFRSINDDLNRPAPALSPPEPASAAPAAPAGEWPDAEPAAPIEPEAAKTKTLAKPKSAPKPRAASAKTAGKAPAAKKPAAKAATKPRPRAARTKPVDL